jgi:hypothetical protein
MNAVLKRCRRASRQAMAPFVFLSVRNGFFKGHEIKLINHGKNLDQKLSKNFGGPEIGTTLITNVLEVLFVGSSPSMKHHVDSVADSCAEIIP